VRPPGESIRIEWPSSGMKLVSPALLLSVTLFRTTYYYCFLLTINRSLEARGLFVRASFSWNNVKCQLDATSQFYWCILSWTCFGYIRASARHHPHRTHDPRSGCQDHHPSKNSAQKTIRCNSTSNAPDDGCMYPKHVELRMHQYNYLVASSWHFTLFQKSRK